MININHAELAFAVGAIEEGIRFDSFEDKFQERFGSRATLPAITFYNLADWVVNIYKTAILKDMEKRTEEVVKTCDEGDKEEQPKIQQISVRHKTDFPGGPYTDNIMGVDLSLRMHDGYIDISDIGGQRYLCHEEDAATITFFPSKKEEKDG